MSDSISAAWALIDDRLDELRVLMTDEPVEVVTPRYVAWKAATSAALEGVVAESWMRRFDLAEGQADPVVGRRPIPPVYLQAAASRALLHAMQVELEKNPAAQGLGFLRIMSLLERRLPGAFRGIPEEDRDVQDGFETLLAGSGLTYERGGTPVAGSSRTAAPEFAFPELRTALELKLCAGPAREKEIIAEIERDLAACASTHAQVIIVIYDLGFIKDPVRLAQLFKARGGVVVRVLRHPKAQ